MIHFTRPSNKTIGIAILITVFALFALWLRLLPMAAMGNTDIISRVAMDDPFYNLRQVEQILANFPNYAWFDPMTNYPTGTVPYWGPLFPSIIAVCCLITGAVSRPEIVATALLVPPFIAAATVAVMYFVGKTYGDWKTGLLAAGFAAVVTGQFFSVSGYGYIDHHIAEVLFSTIFCLAYSGAIIAGKDLAIDLKNFSSYRLLLAFSFLAGIAYLLGLFVMPTMILFALIAGVFTLVQSFIDVYRNRPGEYLLIINTGVFVTAIVGLLLFGLKNPGLDLSAYTIGHIIAYLGLIGGTAVLYILARYCRGRGKLFYPGSVIGIALFFAIILWVASPELYNLLINSLFAFFGQQPVTDTVIEARGWSPDRAWMAFNYGLILFVGGALVMLYNNLRDEHPHEVFALVWSLVMFIATWQHVRYEYYLAINIALLSAVCTVFVVEKAWPELSARLSGIAQPAAGSSPGEAVPGGSSRKKQKKTIKKAPAYKAGHYFLIILFIIVAGCAVLFVYTSASTSYVSASGRGVNVYPDWQESLGWLGNNTPDTGVGYLTIYDKNTFVYPPQSYGVMSWWDYGHMITFISHRIPNANPFQQGVAGQNGSAAYFVATSEETANTILDNDGTRYVITDILMDDVLTGKFPAMATWFNSTAGIAPFQQVFLVPNTDNRSRLDPAVLIRQDYYLTTVSRLHNFDGSLTNATTALYVEYADTNVTQASRPVITRAEQMSAADAVRLARDYNLKAPAGYHALATSQSLVLPVDTVPALQHYRLVHESPTKVYGDTVADLKFVKVFEYVKGARIHGTGIIELPVVTNTGRNFTYRQESVNGEFIVPYATTGNSNGVTATGKYRIAGTDLTFDVPEQAVVQGREVS
ncbi:MAG: oligosaccharyl transferase, archaeosortase A system-associated [Methanoregula sp.]